MGLSSAASLTAPCILDVRSAAVAPRIAEKNQNYDPMLVISERKEGCNSRRRIFWINVVKKFLAIFVVFKVVTMMFFTIFRASALKINMVRFSETLSSTVSLHGARTQTNVIIKKCVCRSDFLLALNICDTPLSKTL